MVQEANKYVVYPDKMKNIMSILVYCLFAVLELNVLITKEMHVLWNILLVVLLAFLIWQIVLSTRVILQNKPLLVLSDEGLMEYTSGINFGLIPWKAIEKIETYADGVGLHIGFHLSDSFSLQLGNGSLTQKVARQNRQRFGYAFSINGIPFGKGTFNQIFQQLKEFGQKNNPDMITKEYEDPFIKRANKNRGKSL